MKRLMICLAVWLALATCQVALADGNFEVLTDGLAYQGAIRNITDGTGPWSMTSPGTAGIAYMPPLQVLVGYAGVGDWLFCLDDETGSTITAADGHWDSTLTVFTMSVTGHNVTCSNMMTEFWCPDIGKSMGVTIVDYAYLITATFATPALPYYGSYLNETNPQTLIGSFSGHFLVTNDPPYGTPIANGDTYGFDMALIKGQPNQNDTRSGAQVPEPMTLVLLGLGGLALRRVRKV